jgi:hypothetical protein
MFGTEAVVVEKVYEDRYRWRVEIKKEGVLYFYDLERADHAGAFRYIKSDCFKTVVQHIENLHYAVFKEWLAKSACVRMSARIDIEDGKIPKFIAYTFSELTHEYASRLGISERHELKQLRRELWDIVKRLNDEGYLILKNADGPAYADVIIPTSVLNCKELQQQNTVEREKR